MPYSIKNFIESVSNTDTIVKIKDIENKVKYLLQPKYNSITLNGKNVIIKKSADTNDIVLDFISIAEATTGLIQLEEALKLCAKNKETQIAIANSNEILDSNDKKAIFLNQIWSQSNDIPTSNLTLPHSVVELITDLSLNWISGTYKFNHPNFADIIPGNYGNGTTYNYILKTSNDVVIPTNFNSWFVDLETEELNFRAGFSNAGNIIVNNTYPPKITFYKYIGTKGSTSNGGGSNSSFYFEPTSNNQTTFTFNFTPSSIKEFYVNGVLIPIGAYTHTGNTLIWNNSDYSLDTTDTLLIIYI